MTREELRRWVQMLRKTSGVREAHRFVRVSRWGGVRGSRRLATSDEITDTIWARLEVPSAESHVTCERWLTHSEAVGQVVDTSAILELLKEAPRFF